MKEDYQTKPPVVVSAMAGRSYACDDKTFFLRQKPLIYLLVIFTVGPNPCVSQQNLWPLPQNMTTSVNILQFIPNSFNFLVTGQSCDILETALARWWYRTFPNNGKQCCSRHSISPSLGPVLNNLKVNVMTPCVGIYPSLESDESCKYLLKKLNIVVTYPTFF